MINSFLTMKIDSRPLIFLKMCFGALMMVYSAGRCSDDIISNRELGISFYGFENRVPSFVFDVFVRYFPFYTQQDLYWKFHAPLMLLCASGIALGFGSWSRLSSVLFAVLKMVLTLQTQHTYNNHEYLYALIAVALSLVDCHDMGRSFIGKIVLEKSLTVSVPSRATPAGPEPSSVPAWVSFTMFITGTAYMMLQNTVYGIPGEVGTKGMVLLIWPACILLLTQPSTNVEALIAEKAGRKEELLVHEEACCPLLHRSFIKVLFSLVYIYAGIAKTSDDWLSGSTARELIKLWTGPTAPAFLRDLLWPELTPFGVKKGPSSGFDIDIGISAALPLFTLIIWGGLLLDLCAPLILHFGTRKMKMGATLVFVSFHVVNHYLFVIETFPWVMISALVLHFEPSEWMEQAAVIVTAPWRLIGSLRRSVEEVGKLMWTSMQFTGTVFIAVLFVALVLIPLPCALHSIGENGSLTWGSQCSYWSWRMMTRSTRVLSVGLFMTNNSKSVEVPHSKTQLWIREVGLRGQWQEAAPYEDRFCAVLRQHQPEHSRKYADVWIEVNGPPFQRYVDPNVDLSSSISNSLLLPPQSYWDALSNGPQPLASWTLPRILSVRTETWKNKFTRLEHAANLLSRSSIHIDGNRREQVAVVFLADLPDGPAMHLSTELSTRLTPSSGAAEGNCKGARTFELQLLSGQASVLNGESTIPIVKGNCLRFQGELILKAMTTTAVWMVVMIGSDTCPVSHKLLRANSYIEGTIPPSPVSLRVSSVADNHVYGSTSPSKSYFRYCIDVDAL